MSAATAVTTATLYHPEKGRAVVDLSQVDEYKAAGYSEKAPEQKPEGKPEGKPEKKAAK